MYRLITAAIALTLVTGCPESTPAPPEENSTASDLDILGVDVPTPVLQGTLLRVTARGVQSTTTRQLVLSGDLGSISLEETNTDTDALGFRITSGVITLFGPGDHTLDLQDKSPAVPEDNPHQNSKRNKTNNNKTLGHSD